MLHWEQERETMEDIAELEHAMENAAERLETAPLDREARAILDRCSELLAAIWKDEER